MTKTKASGLIFLLGGFVLKKNESPELSSNKISSESDRRHYYGCRRNRHDCHRDLHEPWPR